MAKQQLLFIPTLLTLFFVGGRLTGAQDNSTNIRVNVDLVQLNVAVTDNKGNYISGLGPESFSITEDRIPERIATFEEGNEPARQVSPTPGGAAAAKQAFASTQPTVKATEAVAAAGPETK